MSKLAVSSEDVTRQDKVVNGVPGAAPRPPSVWKIFKSLFFWYEGMGELERRTIFKQDITLLSFCCLSFFLKYLDQTNIKSAFVSGMQEDLSLYGNELVLFDTFFTVGYTVFQIPFLLLLSRPALTRYVFPSAELIWGILTLCQHKVSSAQQLYVIRFLLGSVEAISYSGANYVLGSWYRGDQLFKRAGVFQISNGLGKMFSGYLQTAAYTRLNGKAGLAGWRWLFIIDSIITIPIALLGYFFFPGLPASGKPWFMTNDEYAFALKRVSQAGIAPSSDFSQKKKKGFGGMKIAGEKLRRIFRSWHIWICVIIYTVMLNGTYPVGTMSLWLKAEGKSIPQRNNYPTIVDAVGVISTWLAGSIAGFVNIFVLFTGIQAAGFVASLSLLIWRIPYGWKFTCYCINGIQNATNPILFSWINILTRHDAEERAVTLGATMMFGWAFFAWTPILAFPQPEAPRYPKGYPLTIACIIASTALFIIGGWMQRREEEELEAEDSEPVELSAPHNRASSDTEATTQTERTGPPDLDRLYGEKQA